MERSPLVPESRSEDVEACLLVIESYPTRLAPPPATLPGSLPRQQLLRGSQENDIVATSDRSMVPGPGAPPDCAARVQLLSATAADIVEAFSDFPVAPAWMIRRAAPAVGPSTGVLADIPMVGSSVSTARNGRVMPPESARSVEVHPRPAYTIPQATFPGSSARVPRVPSGPAPTGAVQPCRHEGAHLHVLPSPPPQFVATSEFRRLPPAQTQTTT